MDCSNYFQTFVTRIKLLLYQLFHIVISHMLRVDASNTAALSSTTRRVMCSVQPRFVVAGAQAQA